MTRSLGPARAGGRCAPLTLLSASNLTGPASGARRRGAALATLALLAALSWFLYLQLRDLEDQAVRAEHTASLLKMQAGRSVRIADRVGRLTSEVREMQALG